MHNGTVLGGQNGELAKGTGRRQQVCCLPCAAYLGRDAFLDVHGGGRLAVHWRGEFANGAPATWRISRLAGHFDVALFGARSFLRSPAKAVSNRRSGRRRFGGRNAGRYGEFRAIFSPELAGLRALTDFGEGGEFRESARP